MPAIDLLPTQAHKKTASRSEAASRARASGERGFPCNEAFVPDLSVVQADGGELFLGQNLWQSCVICGEDAGLVEVGAELGTPYRNAVSAHGIGWWGVVPGRTSLSRFLRGNTERQADRPALIESQRQRQRQLHRRRGGGMDSSPGPRPPTRAPDAITLAPFLRHRDVPSYRVSLAVQSRDSSVLSMFVICGTLCQVLEEIRAEGLAPDLSSFNIAVHACAVGNQWQAGDPEGVVVSCPLSEGRVGAGAGWWGLFGQRGRPCPPRITISRTRGLPCRKP